MSEEKDWLEIETEEKAKPKPAEIGKIGDPQYDADQDTDDDTDTSAAAEGEGDEHDQYSESVKRRIASLTRKFREAERQRDAAAEYARQVQQERDQFRTQVQQYSTGYATEYENRVSQEVAATKQALAKAMSKNDNAALVEAQTKLTELMWEQQRIKQSKAARQQPPQQAPQQQYPSQQYQQPPQPPQPDGKAVKWAEQNDWFGKDRVLTKAALAVHEQLVEDEGFDASSDEYYTELDSRMSRFFGDKGVKRSGQAVAGVSRNSRPAGSRKVKLTKSQVAMAQRLGVPLEEYAKYVS
jgi:hypothetical protein